MSYIEPKQVLALMNDVDRLSAVLNMNRMIKDHALHHLSTIYSSRANLDKSVLIDANEFLKEHLDLNVPISTLADMFVLYPIESSAIDDIGSTDARDALYELVSHYYLNSSWPGHETNISQEEWIKALKLGFSFIHYPDR